jgi:hypothetical protein
MAGTRLESGLAACNECTDACERCLAACLRSDDLRALARCIGLALDCAQACRVAASLLARDSDAAAPMCDLCADFCERCSDECERHGLEPCRACAIACRRCARACRALASDAAPARPAAA